MADWLSSLRSAGRTPTKSALFGRTSSLSVGSRQTSFHNDDHSVLSAGTKEDTVDSSDSRTTSRNVPKGKSSTDLDSSLARFPKTPRRRGAIAARTVSRTLDSNKESSSPPGSPRAASVKSVDDVSVGDDDVVTDTEGDCVQVCVRVRPVNDNERRDPSHQLCLHVIGTRTLKLFMQKNRSEPHLFHYDNIFTEESPQQEVFDVAGYPVVENCLNGYNSTIFAYGQTGAGKTHTMLGHLSSSSDKNSDLRGLAPRVFEYLFTRIAENEDSKGRENIQYSCRCSFLEIYNESITDLLNPSATNLQIREDIKKGCYVDGLSEESVVNVDEMLALMKRGADNRHTGETRMNRESSRSHSVFTCTLERCSKSSNGLTNIVFSRLNLIDLAGSERQKKSEVAGSHLKEACHINKSLTILGRVIHELVEAQRSNRKSHIPYRDSRLTFLLQDSLGGNAKTWIIANVSPSSCCSQETLSTLQFAQRAKRIRNRAVVNMDTRGDVAVLQKEIARLNHEIQSLRNGVTDGYVMENGQLRAQLKEQERLQQDVQLRYESVQAEVLRYKRERDRAEGKMQQFQLSQATLVAALSKAQAALKACQQETVASHQKELEILKQEARALELGKEQLSSKVGSLEMANTDLHVQLAQAQGKEAQLLKSLEQERSARVDMQAVINSLQKENAALLSDLQSERSLIKIRNHEVDQVGKDLHATREELAREKGTTEQLMAEVQSLEAQLAAQATEVTAAFINIKSLRSELEGCQADLSLTRGKLDAEVATSQQLRCDLDSLTARLSSTTEHLASMRVALEAEQSETQNLRDQVAALESTLTAARMEIEAETEATALLKADLGMVKTRLLETEMARAALEHQLQELQGTKAALEQQVAELDVQLASERREHVEIQAAAESIWADKVEQLEQQLEVLHDQMHQQLEAHKEAQAQAADVELALQGNLEVLSTQLEDTKALLQAECSAHGQARESAATLGAELGRLKQMLSQEQSQAQIVVEQLETKVAELSIQLAENEARLESEQSAHEHAAESAAALSKELESVKQQVAKEQSQSQAAVEQLNDKVIQLSGQLADMATQLDSERSAHKQASETAEALNEELKCLKQQMADEQAYAQALTKDLEGRIAELSCQLADMEAELELERSAHNDASNAAAALEDELQQLKQTLSQEQVVSQDIGIRLGYIQQRNAELEEEIRSLNTSGLKVREELQSLSDEYNKECARIEALQVERDSLEQDKDALQKELSAQQEVCRAAEDKIVTLTEQLSKSEEGSKRQCEEMQQILSTVKQEYEETVAQHAAQIRSRIEEARKAHEEHQQARSELQMRLAAAEGTVSELTEQKQDLLATLDEKLEALTTLQQENTGLQEQLLATSDKLEEESMQLQTARKQIMKLTAELQETQDKVQAVLGERNNRGLELESVRRNAEHAAATAAQTQRQQQKQIEALQLVYRMEYHHPTIISVLEIANRLNCQVEDLSKALEQLACQGREMKQQLQSLTAKLDNSKREASALESTLLEEQAEIKFLKETLAKVEASNLETSERLTASEKKVKELEKQKADIIAETDQQVRRLSTELHRLQQELVSARERLEESYKENSSGALQVARLKHAFQQMKLVIETAHVPESLGPPAPTGVPDGTPPLSIRSGNARPGSIMSMSPSKRHISPAKDISKDAEPAVRDQIRTPQSKIAQQLRLSMDGIANILRESNNN